MNPGEILRTSLSEIRYHKLRSSLTLLGIILGTLSITVMTSFLDGVVGAVWSGFTDLGFDGVMFVQDREAKDLRETAVFGRSRGLQPEDAEVILARRDNVAAVAPVSYEQMIARRGGTERKVRVMGVTEGYNVVRGRSLDSGRFFNDLDQNSFARVCVLGYNLKKRLFGSEDPLGKTVSLDSRPFRVVGVGQHLGNPLFNDDDMQEEMEGLYVPLATLRKFYQGDDAPITFMAVKARDARALGALKAEVTSSLILAHRGAQDFKVQNIAEEILRARKEIGDVLRSWRIVLGSIAGISLLVGGIGLLSVMLISIGERLYEIGLRKAIGASDLDVFMQFLMESVTLSLIGAVLGAAAGVGITKSAAGFFPSGLPINLGGLAFAIGIAMALGVVFGLYPALKASRMAPVDALRTAA